VFTIVAAAGGQRSCTVELFGCQLDCYRGGNTVVKFTDLYRLRRQRPRRGWWWERYEIYLASEAWNEMKEAILWSRGPMCERCNTFYGQELHHKTYRTFGRERPQDIELLCRVCHIRADRVRVSHTAAARHRTDA
jgi:hypothetical protein